MRHTQKAENEEAGFTKSKEKRRSQGREENEAGWKVGWVGTNWSLIWSREQEEGREGTKGLSPSDEC